MTNIPVAGDSLGSWNCRHTGCQAPAMQAAARPGPPPTPPFTTAAGTDMQLCIQGPGCTCCSLDSQCTWHRLEAIDIAHKPGGPATPLLLSSLCNTRLPHCCCYSSAIHVWRYLYAGEATGSQLPGHACCSCPTKEQMALGSAAARWPREVPLCRHSLYRHTRHLWRGCLPLGLSGTC